MKTSRLLPCVLVLAVLVPSSVYAQTDDGYRSAWEQLKRLAGTWDSYRVGGEDRTQTISYHVTSGGSVVFEEFLGDTPDGVRAMATAYHMDGDDVVATHYCGAGNQPRMRSASYDPERRVLRLDFWDVTDLKSPDAYHTRQIELFFRDDDHAELRFRGTEDGIDETEWQVHRLSRRSDRPSS